MNKEDRNYISREDAAENFLADESSSDENIDYNLGVGGIHSFFSYFLYLALFTCGHVNLLAKYVSFEFMARLDKVDIFSLR